MAILEGLLFPPPPSLLLLAAPAATLVGMAKTGHAEAVGQEHMRYSKFWNVPSLVAAKPDEGRESKRLPMRAGMLYAYTPALVVSLAAFAMGFAAESQRALLLCSAVVIHFLKRELEVMFLHRFSSYMMPETLMKISVHYFLFAVCMIYEQRLNVGVREPSIDLKYVGVAVFAVGILGNLYHHYILSRLRTKNDKEYRISKGGLFGLVICPHYLFEILGFIGMALISQTWASLAYVGATTWYLAGRSHATRKWYMSKFEDFPGEVRALVPFVF